MSTRASESRCIIKPIHTLHALQLDDEVTEFLSKVKATI